MRPPERSKERNPPRQILSDQLRAIRFELRQYDALEHVSVARRPFRAKAKAIIEGRARWPVELLPWKANREYLGYANSWEDRANLTRPQRERIQAEQRREQAAYDRARAAIDDVLL